MWSWTKKAAGHAWRMAGEFFTSKKGIATLAAVVVYCGDSIGLGISPETSENIAKALSYYVVGQGVADAGAKYKELQEKKATIAKLLDEAKPD